MSHDEPLMICGTSPGQNSLNLLRDTATGRWLGIKSSPEDLASDALVERLDSILYPGRSPQQAPPAYFAVVDSGVLHAHPNIAGKVLAEVDFTGEGPEDKNGHGTIVSLLAMRGIKSPFLLNVKVIGASGRTMDTEPLLQGMAWLRDWITSNPVRMLRGLCKTEFEKVQADGSPEGCEERPERSPVIRE